MKNNIARTLCSILGGLMVVFIFWLGGLDLTVRGFMLAYCVMCATMASGAIYCFPAWYE